ncbi:MAG: hypothetical protein ACJ79V_22410, partial [Myxococcales bacterium]
MAARPFSTIRADALAADVACFAALALGCERGIDAYLGTGFQRVLPDERRPEESFFEFLRRRHVGVVALGPALERHRLFSRDEQFQAFARDPERFGGHRLAVSSL